jgi:tetratricopeptide (TPR) repeat protein
MRRRLRRWWSSFRRSWGETFRAFARHVRWSTDYCFHRLRELLGYLLYRLHLWRAQQTMRYFLQGLPAVLVGGAVAVLMVAIGLDATDQRVLHYRVTANQALLARNLELAQLAYERLTLLDPDQPEFRFQLALTIQAQAVKEAIAARQEANQKAPEQTKAREEHARVLQDRAHALMKALASPNRQGYGPAHVWWAYTLMRSNPPAAELHLRRALQINADDARANALIGRRYLGTNRLNEAEVHLKKAVGTLPELDFDLALLYQARGTKDLAKLHGEKAQRHFRQLSQADVDNHQARVEWARATLFLGDYPGAIQILQEGLTLSQSDAYRPWLALAYVAWADAVGRDPKGKLEGRLALLEKAVQLDFGNLDALLRLVELTRTKDAAEADKARAALRGLLAEGKSPVVVHLVLGIEAQARDKPDEARQHFEQAYKLAPQTPILLNNMAWALAHSEKPDLEQALRLVNTALQRAPAQLRFRETRGQILAKMGKHEEALADLTAALRVLSGNPTLHKTLAETYRQLGYLAMAAEHERLAQPSPEALPAPPGEKPAPEGPAKAKSGEP